MRKQLYELEIEEILRKCEEAAMREELQEVAHRPLFAPPRLYGTHVALRNDLEMETGAEKPARTPRFRPSRKQTVALACAALLVGLMLSFYDIMGPVPLLIFLALVATAAGAALVPKN